MQFKSPVPWMRKRGAKKRDLLRVLWLIGADYSTGLGCHDAQGPRVQPTGEEVLLKRNIMQTTDATFSFQVATSNVN